MSDLVAIANFMAAQRKIIVKIVRQRATTDTEELEIDLTPRQNWGGRGTLGCHIVPM